ncbi:MAG: hypothetical protein GY754_08040 [bacterium]|nr:hypothetical protein [bacterium]
MDKNGQLVFSDDPMLNGINQAFQHIEEGDFKHAVYKLDELMNINPDYPGLIEGYRTAKFWLNRTSNINSLEDGKKTADFLMTEWSIFDEYASDKNMTTSSAYNAAMKFIFFRASEHYKIAFQKQEDTTNSFDLLLNLGDCFLRLKEYKHAIDTLEYARSSYSSNARLLSILAEAYFHMDDLPKCLLHFREAFFVNPSDIDLSLIMATPIHTLVDIIKENRKDFKDVREWIPVYGFLTDIFYVRRNISKRLVDTIEREIYNLEVSFQQMNKEEIDTSNIVPRLINKYLWMLDYYEFQVYSFENISQIKQRLIKIERELFEEYFKKSK